MTAASGMRSSPLNTGIPELSDRERNAYRQERGSNSLLRLVAFCSIAAAVGLHNRFVLHEPGFSTFVLTAVVLLLYCLMSWLALLVFYRQFPALGDLLVLADILPLTFAVYVSGGDRSLLFFLPVLRVADQTQTSLRRALVLGHAALAAYGLMILWLARSGGAIDWPREAAKFGILWGAVLYTASVARISDRRSNRLSVALKVAQKSAAEVRAKSEHLEESRRELVRAMRRNELILESAGEGIVGLDLDGTIVFANSRAASVVGCTVEDLVGRPGHDLAVHAGPDGKPCSGRGCQLVTALRSGEEQHGEHSGFSRPDGTKIPVEYTSAPIYEEGKLRGAVFSFRDISVKKAAEEELVRARDAAEEANFGKSRFLANMSHELRTPLNAVIGYSEMMREELAPIGREDLVADAEKIRTSGEKLLGIINDILEISRIEARRMVPDVERFNVSELVLDIGEKIRPAVDARGNSLHLDCDTNAGLMRSDAVKIRRVLEKLLENANKFTEQGHITLRVTRENTMINFAVIDTGIGLAANVAEGIFEPFRQADISSTRRFGGTGLGLAIVRALAGLLGGHCRVESEPGKGSVFQVTLPDSIPANEEQSDRLEESS